MPKVKDRTPRLCACGCGKEVTWKTSMSKWASGHQPYQGVGRTKIPVAPPMLEKPEFCPKCSSKNIYLEDSVDMLSTTRMVEKCWKCFICGWQRFLVSGVTYEDKRQSPRPLQKLKKRSGKPKQGGDL